MGAAGWGVENTGSCVGAIGWFETNMGCGVGAMYMVAANMGRAWAYKDAEGGGTEGSNVTA